MRRLTILMAALAIVLAVLLGIGATGTGQENGPVAEGGLVAQEDGSVVEDGSVAQGDPAAESDPVAQDGSVAQGGLVAQEDGVQARAVSADADADADGQGNIETVTELPDGERTIILPVNVEVSEAAYDITVAWGSMTFDYVKSTSAIFGEDAGDWSHKEGANVITVKNLSAVEIVAGYEYAPADISGSASNVVGRMMNENGKEVSSIAIREGEQTSVYVELSGTVAEDTGGVYGNVLVTLNDLGEGG